MSTKKMRIAALTALAVPALSGSTTAPPVQAEVQSGTSLTYTSPQNVSSQYHVYADNIDWSQPVGVVFYFDGDYNRDGVDSSFFYHPEGDTMQGMANAAQKHNKVFVSVDTPDEFDPNKANDYATWWENADGNGDYFRSFAQEFIADSDIDESQVWLMGYSGGAEFITYELDADQQGTWRSGGGSIMVGGGGGKNGRMETQAPQNIKSQPMFWWVNEKDTLGATTPEWWDALNTATAGHDWYTREGFNTQPMKIDKKETTFNNAHTDYDLPGILDQLLS